MAKLKIIEGSEAEEESEQQQWSSAAKPADKSLFYAKQTPYKQSSAMEGASVNDNEIDGLLKWAKDLPDDVQLSQSSFFKQI